ncbi:protein of unknown function [Pararobbsia alpina]
MLRLSVRRSGEIRVLPEATPFISKSPTFSLASEAIETAPVDGLPEELVVESFSSRERREVATRWAIVPPGLPNTTGCFGSPFPFPR